MSHLTDMYFPEAPEFCRNNCRLLEKLAIEADASKAASARADTNAGDVAAAEQDGAAPEGAAEDMAHLAEFFKAASAIDRKDYSYAGRMLVDQCTESDETSTIPTPYWFDAATSGCKSNLADIYIAGGYS